MDSYLASQASNSGVRKSDPAVKARERCLGELCSQEKFAGVLSHHSTPQTHDVLR